MSEFVNVDGLVSPGRPKIITKLSTAQDQAPVLAQLWGREPDNFREIAQQIADGQIPGFEGVDLNFGCPDKAVLKNNCCSAFQKMELRDRAGEIIRATQQGLNGRLPLSLKTRLGFEEVDYSWHQFLLEFKPAMLTVHVRTTKQLSKVPANWAAIEPIVKLRNQFSPQTKIILNGDIESRAQGEKLAQKYSVDGIMIGRGIFKNPYCFNSEDIWSTASRQQKLELFVKHLALFQETYPGGQRKFNPLKKFAKVYISQFSGASELRHQIMQTESVQQALEIIQGLEA